MKQLQYNSKEELTNQKKIVEEEFNEVDAQLTALQSYHNDITPKLSKFDGIFSNIIMVQGLQEYVRKFVKPGIDYDRNILNEKCVDLYHFNKALEASYIFNTFYISNITMHYPRLKLNSLVYLYHK